MQKNIIIGGIGVGLLVATGLIYTLSNNNYLENMQEMRKYECGLRSEKQEILDGFSYSQSIQFARGEFTNKRIIEIDGILKSGISQASDCPGINYNGISFVSKVMADDNTEEVKQKIDNNSNDWIVLDEEIRFRQSRQEELHEENNMLRKHIGVVNNNGVNMYALALAVSKHETNNCTKGFGESNNNCQGMKQSKNCPCILSTKNDFCVFDTKEESHQHFMCVWEKGYGGALPNLYMAQRYSGNDRALIRRDNVLQFYKEFSK